MIKLYQVQDREKGRGRALFFSSDHEGRERKKALKSNYGDGIEVKNQDLRRKQTGTFFFEEAKGRSVQTIKKQMT